MVFNRSLRWDYNSDFSVSFRWRDGAGDGVELEDAIFSVDSEPTSFIANVASGHITLGDVDNEYLTTILVPGIEIAELDTGLFNYDLVLVRLSDSFDRKFLEGGISIVSGAVVPA